MAQQIQLRRDTAANWTAANPILAQGEIGFETNTGKFKIGNGTGAWTTLAYSDTNLASPPAIGSTTPAAGTFTVLTANTELTLPASAPVTPSAGDIYRSADTIRYRDSANTERALLNATDNLSNLASPATARTNLGLGNSATLDTGTTAGTVATGNHTHTAAQVSGLAAVATSGSYNDLSNKPTLGTAAATDSAAYATAAQGVLAASASQPGHTHAAADIASGTIATARLGSGTASAATFLRGDQTYAPAITGTGSVDNAILRADGTGGATLQNSGLVVDDAIVTFTPVTGDAATDIVTATGSAFTNDQPVMFSAITGGSGLTANTAYFVRDVSGATFRLATSIGGAAINFTNNITAGTLLSGHSIQTNVTIAQNTTETNSSLVLTPKGTGALILGPKPDGTAVGGNARGSLAVDLQLQRGSAAAVASGANSFTAGYGNTASRAGAIALGLGNTASGDYSFAGGIGVFATQTAAVCFGNGNYAQASESIVAGGVNNQTTGANSGILAGQMALADRAGMHAHAYGRFSATGDAQRARFVLRCKTTTNSAVEMALNGATTYLSIPANKVIALTINISGVKSDGSAVAHYLRQYCVKNVGGVSSQVYAPVTIGTDNAAGTSINIYVNDPDDTLRVAVTGIAAETWRWVAAVDAVEITYGT